MSSRLRCWEVDVVSVTSRTQVSRVEFTSSTLWIKRVMLPARCVETSWSRSKVELKDLLAMLSI